MPAIFPSPRTLPQRLWFLWRLASGSALYNTIGSVILKDDLDLDALERALTELARRHESLRTTFATREGEPIQVVAPLRPAPLDVEDLRELPPRQRRDALRRLCQAETAQPFDLARGPVVRFKLVIVVVLMAAFHYVLGQNAGQDDVVVGTPIANRTRAELENIIGFFVNPLVMRTDLSGDPTFRQLLQRVHQACLEAYAHQDLPFDRLVEELAPQREFNIQPLFQVLFVLQNTPDAGSMQHRRTQAAPAAPDIAGLIFYDLTLSVT
jgi:hypothetical protein